MRFKTRLRPERVAQLIKICHVLERVDTLCVLHLCSVADESVRLALFSDATGTLSAFATLRRVDWFESYRIESHNGDQIGLELDIRNLSRALRSASAADVVVIKLTKKGVPVLSFEIMTVLGPIKQEIPVMVLSAARLAEFQEPQHVRCKGVALPALVKLHAMVERMKGLSQTLSICMSFGGGGGGGECGMRMRVGTDMVGVSTSYMGLTAATYDVDDGQQQQQQQQQQQRGQVQISTQEEGFENGEDMDVVGHGHEDEEEDEEGGERCVEALVDIRNFAKCLHGYHAQPSHALCFIHGTCVMLHLMLPFDVTISYFVARRTLPI